MTTTPLDCEISGECPPHEHPAERLLCALYDELREEKGYRDHDTIAGWVRCLRDEGMLAADRADALEPVRLAEIRRLLGHRAEPYDELEQAAADLLAAHDELAELHAALLADLPEATDEDCARAAEPARWDIPPEPGPEVTRLRDRYGDHWNRTDPGWGNGGAYGFGWIQLFAHYAPLTDATPALPVTEPEEGA